MKKVFLAESIRLSNWSAVISANDGSGVSARTKGAPPMFCQGKRSRVPQQRKESCKGARKSQLLSLSRSRSLRARV